MLSYRPAAKCILSCLVIAPVLAAAPARSQVVAFKENNVVGVTVTSVETSSGANGWHYLSASVHIRNITKQPLILGVELGKVSSTDDRGNTYAVTAVRGLGTISSRIDPSFTLPAGGGGDALFEMRWRGTAVFGTVFDLKLPLRVIESLGSGQYKLIGEHLSTFTGLKAGHVLSPRGAQSLPPNTVNAGPFTVQITKMTPSIAGNRRSQSAVLAAKIQNTSSRPIILAYDAASGSGVDDRGNPFAAYDAGVSGIGSVTSIKADPQLRLGPGESRDVQFTVWRRMGREVAGTMLTAYISLAELELLPANQIRTVRHFSLTFPRMAGLN